VRTARTRNAAEFIADKKQPLSEKKLFHTYGITAPRQVASNNRPHARRFFKAFPNSLNRDL
jgi:hypothetical protein